jgi:predicted metal-binding membrane protein
MLRPYFFSDLKRRLRASCATPLVIVRIKYWEIIAHSRMALGLCLSH